MEIKNSLGIYHQHLKEKHNIDCLTDTEQKRWVSVESLIKFMNKTTKLSFGEYEIYSSNSDLKIDLLKELQ